ncbi:SDR family oxidoreductase [bacterium]|nr:MAG: SDR family oxidoreductase [bacterium]
MKTILITGATSGIGFETAKALANPSTQLILLVRNLEKGAKVKNTIEELKPGSMIRLIECDFTSLNSIRRAAQEVRTKFKFIDVLINNAGILNEKYKETKDGFEETFGVNFLAPFLLTQELLPLILDNPNLDKRIVNVSSVANKFGKVDFDNLQKFSSNQYSNTKLMINLWTMKLARMYPSISINCLHPGYIKTDIFRNQSNIFKTITNLFFISPERGAKTTIFLATSDDARNISGKYFNHCDVVKPNKMSFDEALQDRLWEVAESMITR